MAKKGIKTSGRFEHLQGVNLFDEEEIKNAREACILPMVERAVRKFVRENNRHPTQLIVGYEESGNIRSALSKKYDKYISSDGMIVDVDGFPVKVYQGCKNEKARFSLVYWENDDINEDVDTD